MSLSCKHGETLSVVEQLALMNQLCSFSRFRMLAEHFQKMYQNLNINIDSDLEQFKVRETTAEVHICCYKAFVYEDVEFDCLLTDLF